MTTDTLHPRRRASAYVAGLVLLVGGVAALALPGTAMASPCGDRVLADWFDNGRIDRVYPLHCYDEAIDSIPADLRDYADAEEVISRALQAAVGGSLDGGGPDPTPRNLPSEPDKQTGSGPNDRAPQGSQAAPEVDTSAPSSVPIPLLVLGGMSLALLGAGGLGYLSRRRHAGEADGLLDEIDEDIGG